MKAHHTNPHSMKEPIEGLTEKHTPSTPSYASSVPNSQANQHAGVSAR
jgi:hypothetical protein